MKFNGCDFFRKNLFGIRDSFDKIGNIELCNFVKVSTISSSFKFLGFDYLSKLGAYAFSS